MAEGKNRKVPQIRFKGVEGEWEETTYKSILTVKHGFAFKGEFFDSSGPYLILTPGNFSEGGGFRYQGTKEKYYVSKDFPKEYILTQNDLVVAMTEQAAGLIGTPLLVPQSGLFLHNQRLGLFEISSKVSEKFLYHQCNTRSSKIAFSNTAAGTKVRHTSPKKIEELPINLPNLFEQENIAELLTALDRLIGLHQRKHEKLVTLKKAMLTKMFPQNGATSPEIRFKGFSKPWEEKKLGEICESYSGGTPSVGNRGYYDGTIPFIRSGEINSDSTKLSLTETALQNSSAKMVEKGDILYALYGATSGEVGISQINGAINQAVLAIKPRTKHYSYFLATWLRNEKESILNTYLQGGQGNLSGNIIKNLDTNIPHFTEQQKIGTYFRQLDKLITQHNTQIKKLKRIKTACLEKMFV